MIKAGTNENNNTLSYKHYLRVDILILRLMGLESMKDVFIDDQRCSGQWCYEIVYFFFGMSILIFGILCEITTFCRVVGHDLDYAIEILTAICSAVLCAFKGMRLWIYRNELYYLLRRLALLWETVHDALIEETTKMAERARYTRFCYTIAITILVLSYAVKPYILLLDHRFNHGLNESFDFTVTVYPTSYPFPLETIFAYFLCVTYEQIVIVYVALYWISCDTLFVQLTTHICIHFKIIAYDIDDLTKSVTNTDNSTKQLAEIAKRHHALFLYCDLIESFYNPIIFLTVIINSAHLCFCVYGLEKALASSNWEEVAKNVFHSISVSAQTVLFCGYSQLVTQKSAEIGHAAYNSQWINQDKKYKNMLLTIIARSQREYVMKAYGLISLNLAQVTTIAKTAGSYLALIRKR